jgi:hypothetical protein
VKNIDSRRLRILVQPQAAGVRALAKAEAAGAPGSLSQTRRDPADVPALLDRLILSHSGPYCGLVGCERFSVPGILHSQTGSPQTPMPAASRRPSGETATLHTAQPERQRSESAGLPVAVSQSRTSAGCVSMPCARMRPSGEKAVH